MGSIGGEEMVKELSSNEEKILVSIRLRPLNEKEITRNEVSDWECIDDHTIICRNNLSERSTYPAAFTFDRVFKSDCSTRKVYEEGAKEVALSVVSGINSSIFAYGQTSSGKTYTMTGITEYAMADIFDHIQRHTDRDFILKFSAMEIYNESVRDLLSIDNIPLRLLDDPERGTIVEKLTEETLRGWNHLSELLSICEAQRQIGETSLNETSSRSHQIIRLTIESCACEFRNAESSSSLTATVNFVDLAGSERASQALSAGTRLKEGCHINRSLLTLGTVIRKLSKGRNGHVPFRDSKLTRILQSSLGGNAKTAIICTLSPARSHVEQSRNTLLFASCAKEVSTSAQVNVVMSDKALVKYLQRELARLENELRNPGSVSVTSGVSELLREKDHLIEQLEKQVKELALQRDLAQSQVEELLRGAGSDKSSIMSEEFEHHYPRLRIRHDSSFSDFSALAGPQSPEAGVDTLYRSRFHGRHGRTESDELQIPDSDDNFLTDGTSPQISVSSPTLVGTEPGQGWGEIDRQSIDNLEDICKDVQCIEIENLNRRRSMDPTALLPMENQEAVSLKNDENVDETDQEKMTLPLKADTESIYIFPASIAPEQAEETSSHGSLKLTHNQSKTYEDNVTDSPSPPWFVETEKDENTPVNEIGKSFPGRPENLPRKLSSLNYNNENGRLSSSSQNSAHLTGIDEPKAQDVEVVDIESRRLQMKQIEEVQLPEEQLANEQEPKTEAKPLEVLRSVKDVGLDPIEVELDNASDWQSEFQRLRREIIELWHSCNVSLVHRTYFFMLFKGDLTDSIYMEVERRRLSFINGTFTQGKQTMEDGRILTLSSSMRALRREREMLSKQITKKLSEEERKSLYEKWGIKLNSKHRRQQLAHRLWTDAKDLNHITASANLVAKLIGFVEPVGATKELFGLNFTPTRVSGKSNRWKRNVMSIV
ncbi:NPK1-activating kinesin-like protein, C-terminal [Dillenia turbinata]|uniref:Kinesin-like protein n=1 Tax=Dillenia turbinata TaxID=194707 RepID=A0AAN8Z4S2_9MAGN